MFFLFATQTIDINLDHILHHGKKPYDTLPPYIVATLDSVVLSTAISCTALCNPNLQPFSSPFEDFMDNRSIYCEPHPNFISVLKTQAKAGSNISINYNGRKCVYYPNIKSDTFKILSGFICTTPLNWYDTWPRYLDELNNLPPLEVGKKPFPQKECIYIGSGSNTFHAFAEGIGAAITQHSEKSDSLTHIVGINSTPILTAKEWRKFFSSPLVDYTEIEFNTTDPIPEQQETMGFAWKPFERKNTFTLEPDYRVNFTLGTYARALPWWPVFLRYKPYQHFSKPQLTRAALRK